MATALSGGARRIDLTSIADFDVGAGRVRPALLQICCGTHALSTEPRMMQMLVALHRARGVPVGREELIELCWGGLAVSDDAINQCVSKLRRAISNIPDVEIVSVPRLGYRLNGVVSATEPPAIAVLPFVNVGGEPDYDYFVEGMVDEIVAALTRVQTLLVISSESSAAVEGQRLGRAAGRSQVGRALHPQGKRPKVDIKIRIATKLVDASRGSRSGPRISIMN